MNKLSLILDAGKHAVYLDKFITTRYDSKVYVRNIDVYWKIKNVLKNTNDSINTITGGVNLDPIMFGEGYWSFNMISEVSVLNGDHNMFEFDVNTNIGNKVGLTIMFEVYVE